MADDLIGVGHRDLLVKLRDRIKAVADGDVVAPRRIVVVGDSGTGKSRLVRNLYQSLRSDQPQPGYWPDLGTDSSDEAEAHDPLRDRKVLGPSWHGFEWPAGALPSFGWWALNCDRMSNGDFVDVVGQARTSLTTHLVPMTLARRRHAGLPSRLADTYLDVVDEARRALAEGGIEAAGLLLDKLGITALGLGLALDLVEKGVRSAAKRGTERKQLRAGAALGGATGVAVARSAAELAETLRRLASPGVPQIVVIEDLHLMSQDLADFIDQVSLRDELRPTIVIGTAWPEGAYNSTFEAWRRSLGVEVLPIPLLDDRDRVELLQRFVPLVSAEDARRVVKRYQNPLSLRLFLSLDEIRERIVATGGRLELTAEDLAALPFTIREMYEQRWRQLPGDVASALGLAAAVLPLQRPQWPFTSQVVTAAAEKAGFTIVRLREILESGSTPWLVGDDPPWLQFREGLLGDVASAHLTAARRQGMQSAVESVLEAEIDELRGDSYRIPDSTTPWRYAEWLTAFTPLTEPHTPTRATAVIAVAHAMWAANNPAGASQFLRERSWSALLEPEHRDTLSTRSNIAGWLGEAGLVEDALAEMKSLLPAVDRSDGEGRGDAWMLRNNIATFSGRLGRADEALTELRTLRILMEEAIGADDPQTLLVRHNLATWAGRAGQKATSLAEFETLVLARRRVLGPDHRDTLLSRLGQARSQWDSGQRSEALAELDDALSAAEEHFPADPLTLTMRQEMLEWAAETRDLDETAERFERLAADAVDALGEHHTTTLLIAAVLTKWLHAAGRDNEAIARLRPLVEMHERVFGADHPHTLNVVERLAACLTDAGHEEEGIPLYRDVWRRHRELFGPTDSRSLAVASDLAHYLHRAGERQEAMSVLDDALPASVRSLGPNAQLTLKIRKNRALYLVDAGHTSDAIAELRDTLAAELKAFGYEHPGALPLRSVLARCLHDDGQFRKALAQLNILLPSTASAFGADHDNSLWTRRKMAECLIQLERFEKAAEQFRYLLAAYDRRLLSEGESALNARLDLAACLIKLGHFAEAASEFSKAVPVATAIYGPTDHRTEAIQAHLVECQSHVSDRSSKGAT